MLMHLIFILILCFLLMLSSELIRRGGAFKSSIFWFVSGTFLLPIWLGYSEQYHWIWFLWVKTYSVLLACVWIIIVRYVEKIPDRVVGVTILFLLGGNILEAVVHDGLHGNYLNSISGLLLILSMPGLKAVSVDTTGKYRNLHYDLRVTWVLGYTIWNLCFTYINWPRLFGHHIAVLSAAILLAVILGWKTWLQARAFTLGVFLLLYNSFFSWFKLSFNTSYLENDTGKLIFQLFSLLFVMSHVVYIFCVKKKTTLNDANAA